MMEDVDEVSSIKFTESVIVKEAMLRDKIFLYKGMCGSFITVMMNLVQKNYIIHIVTIV